MKTKEEIGHEAGQFVKVQTERRLKSAGLTRSFYLNKLKALCDCTKPISCIKGKEADGGTVDFVDIPDNRVQLDAIKTVIELYGDKSPDKLEVGGPGVESILSRVYEKRDGKK